ncbi:hypothetical protein [Cupriavidus pauculus]|uniref:Uncharacterized protein n=1 Tax=Cupriavidus pauculus TaxID=82633 RepID=A0A3G8GV94_9BURK|nr:hypothetical protein [Cupriavidus pauculus]AZG12131.1 hypothetical protein EHF44_01255 [Cupriavidus pauculus]
MTPQNPILIGNSLLNHRLRIILARNTRIPANPHIAPEKRGHCSRMAALVAELARGIAPAAVNP